MKVAAVMTGLRPLAGRLARPAGGVALALMSLSATPVTAEEDIETLSWLTGCWRMTTDDTVVEEHWMAPGGNTMLGMSRTIREGATVGYELLLIMESELGLVYRAHPSGQSTTNFHATTASSRGAVFENRTHDFPRRIAYWPEGANRLTARVDDGSDQRSFVISYERGECPSAEGGE